jgi:hypothetical protein
VRFALPVVLILLISAAFNCAENIEGGGWALVRRVAQGTTWHPADDDLRGTSHYGKYNDGTFSAYFAYQVKDNAEVLFATGQQKNNNTKRVPTDVICDSYIHEQGISVTTCAQRWTRSPTIGSTSIGETAGLTAQVCNLVLAVSRKFVLLHLLCDNVPCRSD